jgi:ribosomal protein S18 acetylase RimI-like enzyme
MDEETPHIEVRAVSVDDAHALYKLDYDFETDRIFTLHVHERLLRLRMDESSVNSNGEHPSLAFELVETPIDPPLYRSYFGEDSTVADVEARLRDAGGGYVALANGEVAGAILLDVDERRSVSHIQDLLVGRQFRRYGIGSLLLKCASDWARERNCWAIVLETQNSNYPAIQFYLSNGMEIWSINRHFYPPGPAAHDIAIFMGMQLSTPQED